jgi:hypothetical protein
MTAIVTDRSAWKGTDFAKDTSWIGQLTEPEINEIVSAADRCLAKGIEIETITRNDFPLPTMAARIAEWTQEINYGRGFVLVRGIPARKLSKDQVRAAFWGIGTYMGSPVSQNSYGEMLGDVYNEGVKMGTGRVRGYRTNQNLLFHTDRCDMVGLLCQRPARTGGLSSLVSSTAIYNDIATNHPEYLQPLYNGYLHVNVEEGGDLSTFRVPVYSVHNGVVSCRILRNTIESARTMGYAKYSQLESDALAYMDSLAIRADLRIDMMLDAGDMQFINNYTTLHARTEFEDFDEPNEKRHMVRLWLNAYGQRRDVDWNVFNDYNGVPKSLERKVGVAGIV